MKFSQRFAYYLIGLLIGTFFVIYFLGAKAESRGVTFCYLPNCRVLKDLRSKPFQYSNEASELLAQPWLDTVDVRNTLTYGKVDFSRSNIAENGGGKLYIVKGKTMDQTPIEVEVVNFSEKVLLRSVRKTN